MGLSREEHGEPGVRCEAVCSGSTRDVFAFENQGACDRALAVTYAVLLAFKRKMKREKGSFFFFNVTVHSLLIFVSKTFSEQF